MCFRPETSSRSVQYGAVRYGTAGCSGVVTAHVSPQVMKKAHVARQRLLRLGIFKDVEVLIDTSEGNGATLTGLPIWGSRG